MSDPLTAALLTVWAAIQGEYWLFWTLHWKAQGPHSYGSHLLFERLYTARREEIDRLAEVIAAVAGAGALDPTWALEHARAFVERFGDERQGLPAHRAAAAVVEVLTQLRAADQQAAASPYAMGVQNVLAGIADKQLEALYLLQQAGSRSARSAPAAPAALGGLGVLGELGGLLGAPSGAPAGSGSMSPGAYVPRSAAGSELQRAWGHLSPDSEAPVGILGDALGMVPGGEAQARTFARGLGVAALLIWGLDYWRNIKRGSR
jgi:DNA-binding ferritin-like protein